MQKKKDTNYAESDDEIEKTKRGDKHPLQTLFLVKTLFLSL